MKFEDLHLLGVGTSTSIGGILLVGEGKTLLTFFHNADEGFPVEKLELTREQWRELNRQIDLNEVEVMAQAEDGKLTKAVIRRTARRIGAGARWEVFRRAAYRCEYCGEDKEPLTVDHLVLWEEGGPSTPDNMACACKKCNKKRGNMQYADWLRSAYYKRVSRKLIGFQVALNERRVGELDRIPRVLHKAGSR